MWELDRLGILEHVQYISAVSGSSLPAAYYTLFKKDPKKWNKETLQKVMSQSLELWGLLYSLNPLRLPLFLCTSYDRTNLMIEVLHNRVFEKKTFADLPAESPRLILNATSYIDGRRFMFTNEEFDVLKSDLSKLPIAVGVMASAAYPGGFRSVTLRDFHERPKRSFFPERSYLHVFDGGLSDNLGIESLVEIYIDHIVNSRIAGEEMPFKKGCLFILVDAHIPYYESKIDKKPHTQTMLDLLVDSNAIKAFSILLETKRRRTLYDLGFDDFYVRSRLMTRQPVGFLKQLKALRSMEKHAGTWQPLDDIRAAVRRNAEDALPSQCKLWHIALTELTPQPHHGSSRFDSLATVFHAQGVYYDDYQKLDSDETYWPSRFRMSFPEFQHCIENIPTRFRISTKDARVVWGAGELLVHEQNTTTTICEWLKEITGNSCRSVHDWILAYLKKHKTAKPTDIAANLGLNLCEVREAVRELRNTGAIKEVEE